MILSVQAGRSLPLFLIRLILCASLLPASAAQTIPFENNYRLGLLIPFAKQWEGPVSLRLTPVDGGRTGTVWFRETDAGILIFGRFSGPAPTWARSFDEMKERDHVDISLRTSLNVELPEIAWGNQFGFETCETYKGIQQTGGGDCPAWEARQQAYRKPLARLFGRLWCLAPGVSVEELATPALTETLRYAAGDEKQSLSELAPSVAPVLDTAQGTGFSYFETLIPWAAFPPTNTLSLDRIYVAIDVADGDKISATTSPRTSPSELPTLAELSLSKPHVSDLTACGYKLSSEAGQSWYIPNSGTKVLSSFRLENQRQGYRYDPEGLSPIPVWTSYFEKTISKTEFICGPELQYVAAGKVFGAVNSIQEDELSLRAVGPGAHLMKVGPVLGTLSPFGSGQCGSCPTASLSMFFLDPIRGIKQEFDEWVMRGSEETDGDIELSPDWKTITVYRAKGEGKQAAWTFARFCLVGDKYQQCWSGPSGPPPTPRQIRWE
jgi:hypothetical protein